MLSTIAEHLRRRSEAHPRWRDVLQHSVGARPPDVPARIIPDLAPTEADLHGAERLLGAYRLSAAELREREPRRPEDLWAHIERNQPGFFGVLARADPRELAAYLCNMSRHDATLGTVQGEAEYRRIRRNPAYARFLALMAKDKLVSLAEAVGALAPENPEAGPWGESIHLSVDELAGRVSAALGLDIGPPPVDGGLLKVVSGRGAFGERDLNAIYTAWMLSGLAPGADLAEIGAGSGRVAYWSRRMGARSYTLFDLPHINVVQGFYLLKALPDTPVSLYGEPDAAIRVWPHFTFAELPDASFDAVLNQDSFPEIHPASVRAYLHHLRRVAPLFVSVNHESKPPLPGGRHLSVPEVVREVGGFRRERRFPYWLRRGYVLEVYAACA